MAAIRLVIVSTTINDETGYLPFDRLAAVSDFDEVSFWIAADRKTPDFDSSRFTCPVRFIPPAEQEHFHCSREIGWNRIMRRNIALLECIASGPDYILLIDDDNVPGESYFDQWLQVLSGPPEQAVVAPDQDRPAWHNYLATSDSNGAIFPRGFPQNERGRSITRVTDLEQGAVAADDIWIFQGISLGDPDVDAATRINLAPHLTRVDEYDYVMKNVWSSCNSQNTVLSRPLFPLAFVWPHCGRYDDIFASFTWQQFAYSREKYLHVGRAFNVQKHKERDLSAELAAEVEGQRTSTDIFNAIRTVETDTACAFLEALLNLEGPEVLTRQRPFMKAFRRDLDTVLT